MGRREWDASPFGHEPSTNRLEQLDQQPSDETSVEPRPHRQRCRSRSNPPRQQGRARAALVPQATPTSERPALRPLSLTLPSTSTLRCSLLTLRVIGGAAFVPCGPNSLVCRSDNYGSVSPQNVISAPTVKPWMPIGLVLVFRRRAGGTIMSTLSYTMISCDRTTLGMYQ